MQVLYIWEDPATVSREDASYFITFIYDFSRYGYVYLLKLKHELTPPYTPQHNEVSERRNRTLLDMVRSMMNLTTLPKSFWGYALEFVLRILNMVPTKKVERTPYEIWHGKAPKLSYLRVWGCKALVKQDTSDKLDPRSIKCIFVGYPKEMMEASGNHGPLKSSRSNEGLKFIQEEDTQPYDGLECEIVLSKVHTDDNVAVPFTKPMPFNKHFEHAMSIGIVPASSLM
ncbi:retrotransposon protein, putative, ty1-copia subclass [Tanacetum coccineum]